LPGNTDLLTQAARKAESVNHCGQVCLENSLHTSYPIALFSISQKK